VKYGQNFKMIQIFMSYSVNEKKLIILMSKLCIGDKILL